MLAPESARVETLVGRFAHQAHLAGYGLIVSPMFEDVGVFRRGVGEESEVVTKEMYEFEDKGGRSLALRPEGTASVVRAFVQHRPLTPWKAWYLTPAFRYERPQAGRFRQHHQLGVEVLGTDDPDVDVEVIGFLHAYLRAVGLQAIELRVNSMGDENCLPAYRELLSAYLEEHEAELCPEHQNSWRKNPLRVLDCKRPACLAVREGAPRLSASLCEECRVHFARVTDGLDALGIAYARDDFLVRGLDYYVRTTFEFASNALDAAQNGIAGGGRYDGLAEALGGPPTPGVGFGSGIERVLLAADAEGVELDGRTARRLRRRLDRRHRRARPHRRAPSRRHRRGPRLRPALDACPAPPGRPLGCAPGGHRRRRANSPRTVTVRVLGGDDAHRQELVERAKLVPRILELLG